MVSPDSDSSAPEDNSDDSSSDSSSDDSLPEADAGDARSLLPRQNRPPPPTLPSTLTICTANVQHKGSTREERYDIVVGAATRRIHLLFGQECSAASVSETHFVDGYGTFIFRSGKAISKGTCLFSVIDTTVTPYCKWQTKGSTTTKQIMKLRFLGSDFTVLNVHRPHSGYPADIIAAFDEDLLETASGLKDPFVILGDMNCRTNTEALRKCGVVIQKEFTPFLDTEPNDDCVPKLCRTLHAKVINFACEPKTSHLAPHGATRQDPRTSAFSCLDYIILSDAWTPYVTNSFRSSPILVPSDHFPVLMQLRPPCVTRSRHRSAPVAPRPGAYGQLLALQRPRAKTPPHYDHGRYGKAIKDQRAELSEVLRANRRPHTNAVRAQVSSLRSSVRKLVLKNEQSMWDKVAHRVRRATENGNFHNVFGILENALHKTTPGSAPADIADALKKVQINLCKPQPPPDPAFSPPPGELFGEPLAGHDTVPAMHPQETASAQGRTLKAFVDGSRLRHRRRRQAGSAVYIPAQPNFGIFHDISLKVRVPASLNQTSAAGEVCAVLLTLRATHHIVPPGVPLEIISDCMYVVHYVNHKLEEMQQQDFSDCAHAPLWRDIVRDLVAFPRYVFSTWIKSHTTATDPDHVANRIVDRLAKDAARDRISFGAPDMSLDHTPIVHSRVRHEKPAYLELDQGIASLNDSAPGEDRNLRATCQLPEARPLIEAIVDHTWEHDGVPLEMVDSLLAFILKKDGITPRPLMLINVIVKIIASILKSRFKVIPLLQVQFGFQRARDTTMAIHLLRHKIRLCHAKGIGATLVFVDYKAAYDSLIRSKIWTVLESRGVPTNVVNIIKSTYAGDVIVSGDILAKFKATSGVKQGCPLSPDIFNIVLDCAIRDSSLASDLECVLMYADDIVLISDDPDRLQRHLKDLERATKAYGLDFNVEPGKTEALFIPPPMQRHRRSVHLTATSRSLGFFATSVHGACPSATALTMNGLDWWVEPSATHLYCPKCAYLQNDHSLPAHALKKLQDHFTAEHKPLRVKHTAPHTPPLRPLPQQQLWAIPPWRMSTSAGPLNWVTSYKYLGSVIDNSGSCALAVEARIAAARGAFFALHHIWRNPHIQRHTRIYMFETVILPCLLYGLECCTLDKTEIRALEKFHSRCVRKIMNMFSFKDGLGRETWFAYETVLFWAATPPIDAVLRMRRLRLAGRITRANDQHPSHKTLNGLWFALAAPAQADSWAALLAADMNLEDVSTSMLADRYMLHQRLHVKNPHI